MQTSKNILSNSTAGTSTLAEERSFDAWGRLRNPTNWTYTSVPAMSLTNRGFTGHEHLPSFGIINMNGRVYDPVLARFLSADDKTIVPNSTQHFNRYSYVLNNPLKYTDPSGWSVEGLEGTPGASILAKNSKTWNETIKNMDKGNMKDVKFVFSNQDKDEDKKVAGSTGAFINGVEIQNVEDISSISAENITVNINLEAIKGAEKGAITLNHEVSLHAEEIGILVMQLKNGDITAQQFKNEYTKIAQEGGNPNSEQHQMINDESSKYNIINKEVLRGLSSNATKDKLNIKINPAISLGGGKGTGTGSGDTYMPSNNSRNRFVNELINLNNYYTNQSSPNLFKLYQN